MENRSQQNPEQTTTKDVLLMLTEALVNNTKATYLLRKQLDELIELERERVDLAREKMFD